MNMQVINRSKPTGGFRELTSDEIAAVSGGFGEPRRHPGIVINIHIDLTVDDVPHPNTSHTIEQVLQEMSPLNLTRLPNSHCNATSSGFNCFPVSEPSREEAIILGVESEFGHLSGAEQADLVYDRIRIYQLQGAVERAIADNSDIF